MVAMPLPGVLDEGCGRDTIAKPRDSKASRSSKLGLELYLSGDRASDR